MKLTAKLWVGLGGLMLLSPLGLILPEHFKAGSAWGEWGPEEIAQRAGYTPQGLAKLNELWKAPLPDYAFKGWGEKGLAHASVATIASAVCGVALIALVFWLIGRGLARKGD